MTEPPPPDDAPTAPPRASDEARGTIWLVEDSPTHADAARRALAPGFDVEVFAESGAMLERLETGAAPDALVLDGYLPGLSGLETLRFVRARRDEGALPVLMLTVRGETVHLAEALELGANDYIAKPYDPLELSARVRALVRTRRLHARALLAERALDAERRERARGAEREQAARAEADARRKWLHELFMQTPVPVAVMEGPSHVITLLNPGYRQIAGADRPLLGKPVREAFPEIEGQGFFELLDHVFETGEAFHGREVPAELDRRGDGTRERGYFDFVYAAYRGPDGRVEGVMATAFEITQQVEARRRAEALAEELRRSEELFRVAQEVSPIGFIYARIVRDEAGAVTDLEWIYQNDAAARINRMPSGRAAAGARLLNAFPALRDSEAWEHYRRVATTGEPWQGEFYYGGEHFDAWFRIAAARPTEETLSLTFEDVTARKRVEQAERETAQRVVDTLESMGDAFFALDADWRIVAVNRRQEQLSQTRREDTLGRLFWDVFPQVREPGSNILLEYERCVAEQAPVHFEHHYAPLDLWTEVDAYPAPKGGVLVFFRDVTARKRLEAERERLYAAAKAGEEQFRTLADVAPMLTWYAEPDGQVAWLNRRWYEYTGLPDSSHPERGWQSAHDPADAARAAAKWQAAMESGEAFEDQLRLRRHDGAFRWFLSRAVPFRDETGTIVRWFGMSVDVDDQRRAADALKFMAEASATLASTLDYEATLASVARLAVPRIADWCIIDMLDDAGEVHPLAVSHVDPRRVALIREMRRRYAVDRDAPRGVGAVLRTGAPELVREVTDAMLQAAARDDEHLRALRELGIRSVMLVPIAAHGRTLGVITMIAAESGRLYEREDLAFAVDLGQRAGAAVDNARLFEMTQRERRRAEEANRAKDEFLSVASHELRTPLTAILGWVRMLRTGALGDDKRERALETIERNARVQVQLVEDILDVSRIITGKLKLQLAPVDPAQVVEAAVDVVRPAAEAKGVRLQVLLDPDAGVLHADAARLQQVVWNLVANGVKFTPRGGRIYVRMQREASSVAIEVSDTGAGIDPAFLPHVFQPFRQQDASITRTHGGLGLGLAIVRHLVELHGGTVEASSEGVGRGATFVVRIPVSPLRSAPLAPATPDDRVAPRGDAAALAYPPALEGLEVLVVDDDPDARELLRSILEGCGARVRTASSAAEALEAFAAAPPDVLVSDIGMPAESGYELIRKVRALPPERGGRVPAVALTAYAAMRHRTRALMEGFTTHAAKPIEPQELVVVVAALAGRQGGSGDRGAP